MNSVNFNSVEIFSNPVLSYHKIRLRPERTSNRISSISKWLFKILPQIMEQLSYTEHTILRMCCTVEGMPYSLFHGQTGSLHWNSNHVESRLSHDTSSYHLLLVALNPEDPKSTISQDQDTAYLWDYLVCSWNTTFYEEMGRLSSGDTMALQILREFS